MSSSEIIVANAPVSYGAFEVTIGFDPNVPDGDEILDQVAAAGSAGWGRGRSRRSCAAWRRRCGWRSG